MTDLRLSEKPHTLTFLLFVLVLLGLPCAAQSDDLSDLDSRPDWLYIDDDSKWDDADVREGLRSKIPVLFVPGHNPVPCDNPLLAAKTPNYVRNWIAAGEGGLPSFQAALIANSHLGIEPYYMDFDEACLNGTRYRDPGTSIYSDIGKIKDAVDLLLQRHSDPGAERIKVVIIGLSRGSISSRLFLKENPDYQGKISEHIAIAPPNHGTAEASDSLPVKQLTNGYTRYLCCEYPTPRSQCLWNQNQEQRSCEPDAYDECNFGTAETKDGCPEDFAGCNFDHSEGLHFIECLNGHSLCDTHGKGQTIDQDERFSSEAPGSRAAHERIDQGVLYVVLAAENDADTVVGGNRRSNDCLGRKLAKNLAPDAVNRWVKVEDTGSPYAVHANTVHTPRVICLALYTAAYHRAPPKDFRCDGEDTGSRVPLLPEQVDIVQVLDRSGSMAGRAAPGSGSKIEELKSAAMQFVELMANNAGRLGLVQFNEDPVPFSNPAITNLDALTNNRKGFLKKAIEDELKAGGRTSIGDGLAAAMTQLAGTSPTPDRSRARRILLVTDGRENEPQLIDDVELNQDIVVDVIGLGHEAGIDHEKLTQLAQATTGKIHLAANGLDLKKYFLETLAGAVGWTTTVDPVWELERGESATQAVTVTRHETGATFTAYWEGPDDAVALRLKPPRSEDVLDLKALGDRARSGGGDRYAFIQLDFPLPLDWVGEWTVLIERVDKPALDEPEDGGLAVRCGVSAFARGGPELDVDLDGLLHATGDEVLMRARLTHEGRGLAGAYVEARCDAPRLGLGTLLRRFKARRAALGPAPDPASPTEDPMSPLDRKLALLFERLEELNRVTVTLELHDDGLHRDLEAGDGVYANVFERTRIPGQVACRIVATGVPEPGGGTTTREWSGSFRNRAAVAPEHSALHARLLWCSRDGCRYRLRIVPRDRFANHLGPGYPVTVGVAGSAEQRVELADRKVRGVYAGEVIVPGALPESRLEVVVGERHFTIVEPSDLSRWSLSLHAGAAAPQGRFSAALDAGDSLTLDVGYSLTPRLTLGGRLGRHTFESTVAGIDDATLTELSANIAVALRPGTIRPYLGAGFGGYVPERGGGDLGGHLGLGVEIDLGSRTALSLAVDYQSVFGEDADFVVSRVGMAVRF